MWFLIFTLVDDCSCTTWIYFLAEKSDVCTYFKHFYAQVQTQFNKSIKIVLYHNGSKFLGLKPFFLIHGIIHKTTVTYIPEQNSRVEQKLRHILNVARAFSFQASLPTSF